LVGALHSYTILVSVSVAILAVTLTACETAPPRDEPGPEASQDRAIELLQQGERESAAAIYWERAADSESPQREDLQLRAAEAVLTRDTMALAGRNLSMIPQDRLRGPLLVRFRLARAKLALMQGRPHVALAALPAGISLATPQYDIEVDELRARASLAAGQILEAVRVRSGLNAKLTDPQAIRANRQSLWKALGRATDEELFEMARREKPGVLRGWLELGYIAKTSPADVKVLDQQLNAWRQRYPGHPASDAIIAQLRKDWQRLQLRPNQIAVMLPLSGAYGSIAQAVLAGFMAAYYTDDRSSHKPAIRVYDLADKTAAALDVYRQAVKEGAKLVVGPLDKEGVETLARQPKLPVPILSLNYSEALIDPPANLYEFGLLPEDEAREAAERASLAGHKTALALAPRGEWGERLLNAFRARFEQLGGRLLDIERYDAEGTDFSAPIKDVLGIEASEQRYLELRELLRRDIKFEPKPRPDADMLFMIALPRQARLLRPQLRFHYAANLPVYSTSHIYTGIKDIRSDRDIDGVIYCDMPWMFEGANPAPGLRARMDHLFPQESLQLPRLTALGFDAYRLIVDLKKLAEQPYERHAGLTGNLYMDDLGRIHRELDWGQFVDGEPQTMDSLRPGLETIVATP
jgi:outer membrane PBP1 activator LpoA protein